MHLASKFPETGGLRQGREFFASIGLANAGWAVVARDPASRERDGELE